MSILILEGVESAKSTVAKHYEGQGWEVVHLSAPDKKYANPDYKGPTYFDWYTELLENCGKNVVYDRSAFGELIWSEIYGRQSVLSEEEIEVIVELENSLDARRVLMVDPNIEDHWSRCVANKEPLTKAQFARARSLYSSMAHKYGFETLTLPDFLGKTAEEISGKKTNSADVSNVREDAETNKEVDIVSQRSGHNNLAKNINSKTKEQLTLEEANAINEILSKKMLKQKGEVFEKIESEVRQFLNNKLGELLGISNDGQSLTKEELQFFKAMYKRVIEKENK